MREGIKIKKNCLCFQSCNREQLCCKFLCGKLKEMLNQSTKCAFQMYIRESMFQNNRLTYSEANTVLVT